MKFLKYVFYLGLVVVFTNCTAVKEIEKNETVTDSLSSEQKFDFRYNFFEANKYAINGDYDMAISLFRVCLSIDSTSSASYYKLASIYLYKKEFALAEQYAEKAVVFNNTNVWYLYLAGNLYTKNQKYELAIKTFEKLISLEPDELDFHLNLADVYLQQEDYKGALKIYSAIEKQFGMSEIISMQKHKIYLSLNDFKDALNELTRLYDAFPSNVEYHRNIADFYLKSNKIDEAIVLYTNILKSFPNDGYSYIGLAECYRLKNDVNKSFNALKMAFSNDEVSSDIKVSLLVNIIGNLQNNTDLKIRAIELTEILLKLYPDNPDINTIYANFLLQANDIVGARNYLEKVIDVRKDKYAVWEQLILIYNQLQDWNNCFKYTTQALNYFPNQSFFYFFNGFSGFQLEKYQQALGSFEFGFKLITSSDPLYNDYLTFLGELYYKTGNKEKAYKMFDKLLSIDNTNIMVLNNYAYYLSVDNKDLQKAEKMSKNTIEKEPENPTYLDTYAWILFKLKRYNDALIYIKKAVEKDNNISDVILEHYGDILYFNNMIDEALLQWNKAKLLGEGSGLLNQKINEKRYID